MAKSKEAGSQPRAPQRSTGLTVVDRAGHAVVDLIVREVRERDGRIVALKSGAAKMRLSEKKKEIAIWGYGEYEVATITADGYRTCNTIAQVSVLTPPSIEVPGIGKVANPYVKLSEETDAFRAGWCRKVAIAPGPTGSLCLTDRTTYLSLVEYLLEDLKGVAKKNPSSVVWGVRGLNPATQLGDVIDDANEYRRAEAKRGKSFEWNLKFVIGDEQKARAIKSAKRGLWGFYPVDPVSGQGLWFDRASEAVAGVFSNYIQKGKFAVRQLEAITYRNCLRDHPLLPAMQIPLRDVENIMEGEGKGARLVDRVATVTVWFHEQETDEEKIRELVQDFERGLRTAAYVEIEPEKGKTPIRAKREDGYEGNEDDDQPKREDPEDDVPFRDRAEEEGTNRERSTGSDAQGALLAEIRTAEDILGADLYEPVRKKFPGLAKGLVSGSEDDLRAYLKALNNEANARADGSPRSPRNPKK